MEDSITIDAKRILLRYGAPISVPDTVTKEEPIRLAPATARAAIPDLVARLRDLLLRAGLSSDDASGTGTDRPIRYRRLRYLYYIVHKGNIASILASGALLCRSRALAAGISTDISDPEVNRRRSRKIDSIRRRPLHDYVNLYFRARNPMLYARRQLQSDLVVLCVDHRLLEEPEVVFTDGNAASSATRFFYHLADLKQLAWDCLEADYWNDFDDGRRTRCAEVLVPGSVSLSRVERAVVSNEPLRRELTRLGWPTRVAVRPEWFF